MFVLFMRFANPDENDEIWDLGVTSDRNLVESYFFEKMYLYHRKLTAAFVLDCEFLVNEYRLKGFVGTTLDEKLSIEDKQFEILFCNAVIEHVGTRY